VAGHTHSGWLVGETDQCGQDHVLASHSVPPERARALTIRATYGPLFGGSSPSADLQSCLENRLRARLDVDGSPEYVLTWKRWDMASGVPICALRASARRTSGKGCGGWPTLCAVDSRSLKGGRDRPNRTGGVGLCQAMLNRGHTDGYLNPTWAGWFMGYDQAHTLCGVTAMQSYRKLRRNL
jgi:hypothetical protein